MKRKLIKRNKSRVSKRLKIRLRNCPSYPTQPSSVTYDSIRRSKLTGQKYYQQRIARQNKLKARQLKKLRQMQQRAGFGVSKFGGICNRSLKPASAVFFKK
ncbi:hypothetical protein [Rheinheimera aquimaris]|uniref:hypothetical protein n=1 Tax=Rheinheimera aquimaris TaxID=412437 RepID=UPI001066ED7D|nr:hypothetical protein [Rheinheimera aquimaris]